MKKTKTITFGAAVLAVTLIVSIFADLSCTDAPVATEDAETEVMEAGIQVPKLSGNIPLQVNLTGLKGSNPVNARPFFDLFSWEMFIALNWPLDGNNRGVPKKPNDPETFLNMSNTTPVVWASYKNQFDLFGQGNNTPSDWNSWTNPMNICNSGGPVNHVFGSSKSVGLDGSQIDEAFSVPLIDQQKNYTLFEMLYNKTQYNFIKDNKFYLRKDLVKYLMSHNDSLEMPWSIAPNTQGSIMIKAAWKELTASDDPSIYYVINEKVFDPVTKTCTKKQLGLVGIHIVHKLKDFKRWIWSSFEHRNNVPGQGSQQPYSYNNDTNHPETQGGWANRPSDGTLNPDRSSRVPAQVTRFNKIPTTPIDSSTVDINAAYQKKLENTVWKNYQLVITQWPTQDTSFIIYGHARSQYPKFAGQPFPVDGCTNTAAETFYQAQNDAVGKGGNSCMSCHYQSSSTDQSWSLLLKSH